MIVEARKRKLTVDLRLVQKCHEHGAQNLRDAMRIAMQVERALEASKLHGTTPNVIIPSSHYYSVGGQTGYSPCVSVPSPGMDTPVTSSNENTYAKGIAELKEQVNRLTEVMERSINDGEFNGGRSPVMSMTGVVVHPLDLSPASPK